MLHLKASSCSIQGTAPHQLSSNPPAAASSAPLPRHTQGSSLLVFQVVQFPCWLSPGVQSQLGARGWHKGAGGSVWAAHRWSTGVIMYTLLAGSPPFWHRKQMLMLRMIMNGDYQFGSPEWDDRSDTVKDLVGAWAGKTWSGGGVAESWDSPD